MLRALVLSTFICHFAACSSKEREVHVYSVPKTLAAAPVGEASLPAGGIHWQTPSGWKALPGNDIRLASFEMAGKADAYIVMLGGDGGGLDANVNRWRQQAGQPALSHEEILRSAETGVSALGDFRLFSISGQQGKDSILAALFATPGRTVFVKLTGKPAAVAEQKTKFLALCRSLTTTGPNHGQN